MSIIDLVSVSNESLAAELYRRVAPKSPLLVIGSNINHIQHLVSIASNTSKAPMITDSGVFVVVNTDQAHVNPTHLRPLNSEIVEGTGLRGVRDAAAVTGVARALHPVSGEGSPPQRVVSLDTVPASHSEGRGTRSAGELGKFIEIQTSARGLRQVPRIRKRIKQTLQKHPMVANIGLLPLEAVPREAGPRYRIAIDVYTEEPQIHQQIASSVDGTMDDFVFQFYPRRRSKMILENRQGLCSEKHGPHNPDGTVSFRIHYPASETQPVPSGSEGPPVQNGSAFRYASNFHVFATSLGSNIGHGDLIRASKPHFGLPDVKMAMPCLGTSQCRYVHRFDKGEYTDENDIAFTEEIIDSEIQYREESRCSIADIDAILYGGRLGNIKDPELFEIQIKTHRGIVRGRYMGIYNYTEDVSENKSEESASDDSVSDGSNKSDSAIRPSRVDADSGSRLSPQISSNSGGSEASQSSIRGDRLEFFDQIRTRLHAGLRTDSGDSGSPVYLVDKRSNQEYLIGVHRSRHHEDAYAVPMAVILEYSAQNLHPGVGGHDASYTWRLTSVEDNN